MPIIILGLLVVAGLVAYMYFSSHSEKFVKEKTEQNQQEQKEDPASVIYLPNDIEKEKKKRNVKTGK